MTRGRQLRPAAVPAEVGDLFYLLRDSLGKADAFISVAEELIEQPQDCDDCGDGDLLRRRSQIEHLLDAAKLAVRAAGHTSGELEEIARRRGG